jgi:tRNA U34 5-methylaminomethyl-2-thiouridine-forming methyltransferase MnmC
MPEKFYPAITPPAPVLEGLARYFQEERQGDPNARTRAQTYLQDYLVVTGDGSCTLPSQAVGGVSEHMHSTHGAVTEARMKFAVPSGLQDEKQVRVLDLCSGLGYNAAALLEQQQGMVELDLVEYSPETLAAALLVPEPMPSHQVVKRAIEDHLRKVGYLQYQTQPPLPPEVEIRVHTGDARLVIRKLKPPYQAVFLDPFSPSKSPELYSAQFLKEISQLLSPTGRILTYTSAAPVRMALVEAGLEVGEGPRVSRRGGTIASPSPEDLSPLNADDERMIALSDAGLPYQDPGLKDHPPDLLERRSNERKEARNTTRLASTVRTPVYLHRRVDDPKLKKRIERQLNKAGLPGLDSAEARYLVCPQYEECICSCGQGRYPSSHERIVEMQRRLEELLKVNLKLPEELLKEG